MIFADLVAGDTVFVDANSFIYHFAPDPVLGPPCSQLLQRIDNQELADPNKPQFAQEMEYCKEQGVKVVRIPVKLGGWPTSDDVRKFLEVVQEKQNQPVLVHCAQGVRRTGMMVAAFQESVLGWDKSKAKSSLLTFGHSDRTVKDVERFIGVYDAKERTVTAQLEPSQEE